MGPGRKQKSFQIQSNIKIPSHGQELESSMKHLKMCRAIEQVAWRWILSHSSSEVPSMADHLRVFSNNELFSISAFWFKTMCSSASTMLTDKINIQSKFLSWIFVILLEKHAYFWQHLLLPLNGAGGCQSQSCPSFTLPQFPALKDKA